MVRVARSCPDFPWCAGAAVLLVALIVRCAVLLVTPGSLQTDPDGYRAVAENLVHYGTFGTGQNPTAYRPPLYPCLLAGCVALGPASRVAIALLHLALGIGTVWLTYRLGRSCGLGRWAWLAAGLVACDPILLAQSTLVMTETLATFLAVAALECLALAEQRRSRRWAIAAGGAVGLCVLCRPTFLAWAILVYVAFFKPVRSLWSAAVHRRVLGTAGSNSTESGGESPHSNELRALAFMFAMAVAAVIAPWAIRNQIQFGRPIVTTTHGGYTLLLANNPDFYEYLRSAPAGTVWECSALDRAWAARMPRGTPADEVRADRMAYADAFQNIRNEPAMFCYASLVRIGRLYSLAPHQVVANEGTLRRLVRYAVGAGYAIEFGLALFGFVVIAGGRRHAKHQQGWIYSVLLVACLTAAHAVYWTDMRMRAPLMPVLNIAVAWGLASIGGRIRRRNPQKTNDLLASETC